MEEGVLDRQIERISTSPRVLPDGASFPKIRDPRLMAPPWWYCETPPKRFSKFGKTFFPTLLSIFETFHAREPNQKREKPL
jgi:hypothetical protein